MNDDNKILNQNAPPVAAQPVQPPAPVVPAVPVGSVNKEVGPVASPVSEVVQPSEVEPQIDEDLKELGVEAKKEEAEIADEQKGTVESAKQFAPVSSSSAKVTMLMSEEEITQKLKAIGQDDDSEKWLARLLKKIISWGFRTR